MPVALVHTTAKASQRREQKREGQVAAVLEIFADRRTAGTAHVLFGDFNATSPLQEIERQRLPDDSRKHFDRQGELPRRAIQQVLTAGYLDALAAHDPQAARSAATFTTLQPGQRVDYIFTFGLRPEQIAHAWIETDRLAQYASDHFPIGAELRL
jgi:endonuclease/exonuclease/phosphatase family metal-dependent hydrolase